MQMLTGGGMLIVVGMVSGELGDFSLESVTILSALSVVYLVIFGSLIAFSSYIWLLKVSTPARVSTYAFVNPVIALTLGWMFAGEELNARILIASLMTVIAVALIVGGKVGGKGKHVPPASQASR
jgi:drug/metabolite transporter (DMT)-like permease